jgi:hypothetical protein
MIRKPHPRRPLSPQLWWPRERAAVKAKGFKYLKSDEKAMT